MTGESPFDKQSDGRCCFSNENLGKISSHKTWSGSAKMAIPVVSAEEIINGQKKVAQHMGRAVNPVEVETTLRASAEGRNNAKRLTHVSTAQSNSGQSHT